MPEVGIVMTLNDKLSSALKTIAGNVKAFDKNIDELNASFQELTESQEGLITKQTGLKKALEASAVKVSDARKEYRKLKDEASKGALDAAIEEQALLQKALKSTEAEIKFNNKAYEALEKRAIAAAKGIQEVETRSESAAQGMKEDARSIEDSMDGKNGASGGLAKGIMSSGLLKEAGEALSGYAGMRLSSALGEPTAQFASQAIGGAMSGAAAGAFLGLPGMALGALIGGASGALSGHTAIEQAKDETFKSYYTGLYDTASGEAEKRVSSGSATAAQREKDMISFTTLFGDKQTAEDYLSGLVDMANTTPFLYNDLTAMSKTLATYGYGTDRILPTLQTVGDTGAALGMSTSDMNAVATALGRMESSDKATLEYLNILNDRGVGAVGYLAEAKGMSVGDTYSAISKGEISGTEAVQIILDALERDFSGSMKEQSQTFEGLSSTLEGLKQEIDNAAGEGYNTLRNKGMAAEIADYGGALGEAMKEASRISGENAAYMENLKEQYRREALGAVLTGEETGLYGKKDREQLAGMREEYLAARSTYENAQDQDEKQKAALKIEELQTVAEGMATAAYEASDQYKMTQEAEEKSLTALRENTSALNAASAAYSLAQERTKGMGAATIREDGAGESSSKGTQRSYERRTHANTGRRGRYAFGLNRVPYDNYPALLHEGERVLTARETRLMDRETERLTERNMVPSPPPAGEAPGLRQTYENRTYENADRRGRYAFGLERAPYDNYPALLHEGERVLTARETRLMDRETDRLRETERLTERNNIPSPLPAGEASGLRRTCENRTYENTDRRGRYAYGLNRVPYDNYPALLHEGERVLTARETRLMDRETDRLRETERLTERNMVPSPPPAGEAPGFRRTYENRTCENADRRGRYAFGLERVPYDNYPALLHQGERVLTARETRLMDREKDRLRETERLTERNNIPSLLPAGEAPPEPDNPAGGQTETINISVTVSGNTFGAGLDEAAVAQALADQIALQLKAGGGR